MAALTSVALPTLCEGQSSGSARGAPQGRAAADLRRDIGARPLVRAEITLITRPSFVKAAAFSVGTEARCIVCLQCGQSNGTT